MGLTDEVKLGQLPGLCALRDTLAANLEDPDTPPHSRAPLARQLQAVLREIEALTPRPRELNSVDQLAADRAERLARARAGAP